MSNDTRSTSTEITVTVYQGSGGLYVISAYAGPATILATPIEQTSTYFTRRVPAKKAKLLKRATASQKAYLEAMRTVTATVEL